MPKKKLHTEEHNGKGKQASSSKKSVLSAPAPFDANKSVVQVFNSSRVYDYTMPYAPPRQSGWSGSGVVVPGKGILTNAHVATDANLLQVRLANSDKLYPARLDKAGIGQDCDLALLRVDDPEFWAKTQPVEVLDDFAPDGSEVHIIGFPFGGKTVNHTKGIVGRLDHQDYVHSGQELAVQQVDAAINPGNSGGPAIVDGKVGGIAFQGYSGYQNIAYIIPAPVVRHYLEEVKRGECKGFPELQISTQPMRNPTLRHLLSMRKTDTGLLVNGVSRGSSAAQHLQVGDIIVSVEGKSVTDLGNIAVSDGRLVDMQHIANMKFVGDTLHLQVLRDNEIADVEFELKNSLLDVSLVPMEYEKSPTYYANTGFVFQPLTFNYFIDAFGLYKQTEGQFSERAFTAKDDFQKVESMRAYAEQEKQTTKNLASRQIVFISNILPIPETTGFGMYRNIPVLSINGRPIMNMADVIRAMEGNKEPQHFIILANNAVMAIPNVGKDRQEEINAQFGIPVERSADLKQLPEEEDDMDLLLRLLGLAGVGPEAALWPDEDEEEDPDYDPDESDDDDDSYDEEESSDEESTAKIAHAHRPGALYYQQLFAEQQSRIQEEMARQMRAEETQQSREQLSRLKMQM